MDDNEEIAIEPVVDRISDRFPTIERSRIESLVEEDTHALDGAPVRDFIPVLVEHQVMDTLREEADPVPIDEIALASRLTAEDAEPADEDDVDPYEVERRGRDTGIL